MTEKTPIQQNDYWRFKWLQSASLSPDGQHLAYSVSHHDAASDTDRQVIWLMNVTTGAARQMTTGTHNDHSPRFSPDNRRIGFISDRSGVPQAYELAVDGGEARQLTHIEQGVREGPVWSPDGQWIAFVAGLPKDRMPDFSKPYRLTRSIYRFNEIGFIHAALQQIYVMPATGGEARPITDADHINGGIRWSPDSSRILYGAAFPPDSFRQISPIPRVVTLDGSAATLLEGWGQIGQAEWIDDERIALIGSPYERKIGTKDDLWVLRLADHHLDLRTASVMAAVGGGLQCDLPAMGLLLGAGLKVCHGRAYTHVQEGGAVRVFSVALDGAEDCQPILSGECYNILLGCSDAHLLYTVNDFNRPPDLYISDHNGEQTRQLTAVNAALLAEKLTPEVVHLRWPSTDGTQVEGWYLKPTVGEAPYPTVLYIHGGPWGAFGYGYSFDFQLLNGAGYGVLAVNYRGSTGYGDDFGTAIIERWGDCDYQDLMSGVDHVIALGLADADRLGVCGLSAGGYHTSWIITQTDRFKAAIPENPVTNLVTLYTLSDVGPWLMEKAMNGTYYEKPEAYVRSSPITYANRCKTPTLLIQGDADFRCPTEQSEQFYAVLRAHGCIVEMLRLPGASHAATIAGPPPIRRAQNEAMIAWFDRYILGREAAPASAADVQQV